MNSQLSPEEQHLADALEMEAAKLEPSSSGLAVIQHRISELPTPLEQARVRRNRRTGVIAGVVALGLAAAATIFAVEGGLQQTVPDPARTPTSGPTTVDTRFDPSSPRTSWTVYRTASDAGKPVLIAEEVRARPPYEARQALDAMFATRPLDGRSNDPNHGVTDPSTLNTVASVELGDDAIEVDLASVNAVKPYDTGDDAAWARAWVQGWVQTIQSAYGSELPVLITRQGQPLTLFGYVDTTAPIKRDDSLRVETPAGVFLPRADEAVTSPVTLSAQLPTGEQRFVVTDLTTQALAFDETVESQSGGVMSFRPDLPAGRYELQVTVRSTDENKQRELFQYGLDFTVTGADPASPATPVTNPATRPVTLAAVFYPDAAGRGLVQEQRAVTAPADALRDVLLGDPSSPAAQAGPLLPGSVLTSVTGDSSAVTVDFSDLGPKSASDERVTNARRSQLKVQAILRTLQTGFGADATVRFSLNGEPTGLYGLTVADSTAVRADVAVVQAESYDAATADPLDHIVLINGRVPTTGTTLVWSLLDPVSKETRFQGVAVTDPTTRTYAFGLEVPAGDYLVELDQRSAASSNTVVRDVTA